MNKSSTQRYLPIVYRGTAQSNRPQRLSSLTNASPPTASVPFRALNNDSFVNMFDESQEKNKNSRNMGNLAKLDFYNDYKNIIRLEEKFKTNKNECSPNIPYLTNLQSNKLKPKTFGLIKKTGKETSIDIRLFSMGDRYANAFSQGLKTYSTLQNLNLKSNRLTDIGNEQILSTIDVKQLKRLNLAENQIGSKSLEKIIEIVSKYDSRLKYLNLEKTCFGDFLVIGLCNILIFNKTLSKLILAKNNLSDRSAKYLRDVLAQNRTLKVLDLHWNNFRSIGATLIFEGLAKNSSITILDFSWNSIGKNEKCAEAIGSALKANTNLAHLDISYNSLSEKDCIIISEYIKFNHTLLGIHLIGNTCKLDPKGFIFISKDQEIEKSLFYKRIIEKQNNAHDLNLNCWVCEKWVEQTFTCESKATSVFFHLEIENYKPENMINMGNNIHEITRAVPPKPIKFFFSEINGTIIKSSYKKVENDIDVYVSYYEGAQIKLNLDTIETLIPEGEVCNLKFPFFTKPRTLIAKPLPPSNKLERIKWSIGISIFKDYVFDNERIYNDCLEFDWKYSRLSNFIRTPEEQLKVKAVLKTYYKTLKITYKILSAYSGNDLFSIGSNVLTEFLNQSKVFDSLYAASDFGVNLNSTLVQKEKGQIYNPGNSLVRYEFMEILVRIAADRYIRNKICNTPAESIKKFIEDDLMPIMSTYTTEKWRIEEYVCEEVDLVLKANKDIFIELFKKYSGKYTLPGKKPFMSLEEFRTLCVDGSLIGDNFAARDVDVFFSQAMMTQVDELYYKRHMEMSFVEMLEAISRALDNSEAFSNSSNKLASIIQTRLSKKIETSLPWLLKICPLTFQDSYVFPTTETYTKMMYKLQKN